MAALAALVPGEVAPEQILKHILLSPRSMATSLSSEHLFSRLSQLPQLFTNQTTGLQGARNRTRQNNHKIHRLRETGNVLKRLPALVGNAESH